MTLEEANKIYSDHETFDNNFRAAKKRGDFKKASDWKAKRDALEPQMKEVFRIRREAAQVK